MSDYPYLDYTPTYRKKKSLLRTGFIFVSLLSMGLNVYLISYGGLSLDSILAPAFKKFQTSLAAPKLANAEIVPAALESTGVAETRRVEIPIKIKEISLPPVQDRAESNPRSLNLKIKGSLTATTCKALSRKDGCELMSAYLGRILAWLVDVQTEMRAGDTLDVIYERVKGAERFQILKLTFHSRFLKKTVEANYYAGPGVSSAGYFDRQGKEIAKRIAGSQAPIKDYLEITSLPGEVRKGRKGHAGTDFKAKVGTPVFSSFEGRVTRTNWNRKMNGYCVEIDHPAQGVKAIYLHLRRVSVKRGAYVKQGQKIGESGNTGRSFAPHLHYEIRRRNNRTKIYNPFKYKRYKTYTRTIPQEHMAAFQKAAEGHNAMTREGSSPSTPMT